MTKTVGQYFVSFDAEAGNTLSERLHRLHEGILEGMPDIERVACASYDSDEGELKTFIHSSISGQALSNYAFKLAESASLSRIAETGESRVIDEIQSSIEPNSPHSEWLLSNGYHSSFTVPMYDNGQFIGLIFFDSFKPYEYRVLYSDGLYPQGVC